MPRPLRLLLPALGLLGVSTLAPVAFPQAATGADAHGYSYGPHPRQRLDAYWDEPESGPQPGIVLVHGGYWNGGTRASWKATAEWFAEQGFAVFSIDHRRTADAAWPAPRDDLYRAITWIKTHARTFRLDRNRLAVIGSQGGGHLAVHAATHATGRARVRAAVGLSAVSSPQRAYEQAQSTAASAARRLVRDEAVLLANCTPLDRERYCLARFRDMNAASHAGRRDAPLLLFHSRGDVVPASQSHALRKALAGAGSRDVTVRVVPGSATGGALLSQDDVRSQVLRWVRARTLERAASLILDTPPAEDASVRGERDPSRSSDDDGHTTTAPREAMAAGQREVPYAYGPHARHRLTAYYLRRRTRQPAVVLLHGGYWYEGDRSSFATFARHLVGHGYAVFSINYRLNTQAGWHAQRSDVHRALRWIRSRAASFSVNPGRIVLVGNSAGGHLATSVGVHGTGTRHVRAVAALSPVADPYRAYQDGQRRGAGTAKRKLRDTAVLLARCAPPHSDTTCRRRWNDLASHQHAGAGDTPMFLVHARGDFVPPAHSARLCRALRAASVRCTQLTVPGGDHGLTLLTQARVRDRLVRWLKAHD
ncbi:MAG TPA: alpha/beta hydrolase [Thermomonospora sp.]|nr:alpha/beta hydrolase [Thermomonospora sp.]